jgi:hypothetical protein
VASEGPNLEVTRERSQKQGFSGKAKKLELALRQVAKRSQTLRRIRYRLIGTRQRVHLEVGVLRDKFVGSRGSPQLSGLKPENIVWIFGTGRSGSSWLRSMMGEMRGCRVWEEPLVGKLFGEFYNNSQSGNLRSAGFIMGDPTRKGWKRSIRNFVLDGARYARPGLRSEDYLVIKEPNGSEGAPLLMEALPESRMIFLIRDPRDVVSSVLAASRRGSWLYEWGDKGAWKRDSLADERPDLVVSNRAHTYLRQVMGAKQAYEAHQGRKVLVRYEDLRADTLSQMKHIYSELEMDTDEKELERVVEEHSWEMVPEEEKGPGKFKRKATPGGWREDLTPEQVDLVEQITAPLLKAFYPEKALASEQ